MSRQAHAIRYCALLWSLMLLAPCRSEEVRFDVNDVSYLWPAPKDKENVDSLLSADTRAPNATDSIWPKELFEKVIEKAQAVTIKNSAGQESTIDFGAFKNEFQNPLNWKVVAFRADPSASGTLPMFTEAFGVIPQIRLILQPVTMDANGKPKVHDFTVHLVFNYVERFDPPHAVGLPAKGVPDKTAVKQIVADLVSLKKSCEAQGVPTSGKMNVHPGLAKLPGFAKEVKAMLLRNLKGKAPFAVAFMGVDGSEPWIFFAMARQPNGSYDFQRQATLGNEFSQMITFRGGTVVMPQPKTTNIGMGLGVSTALLFKTPGQDIALKLDKPVFENKPSPLHRDIPDIIANPKISHFFNTDCASCHSESTRRANLNITESAAEFRYRLPVGISGVAEEVLPKDSWNVRNFGWFQKNGRILPTISQRTANETAEAVEEFNKSYLANPGTQP